MIDSQISIPPPPWTAQALCAEIDPELFFPEKGGSTREAKAMCGRCDVRERCLDYALANHERFGIWGGMSERDRRKLPRRLVPVDDVVELTFTDDDSGWFDVDFPIGDTA